MADKDRIQDIEFEFLDVSLDDVRSGCTTIPENAKHIKFVQRPSLDDLCTLFSERPGIKSVGVGSWYAKTLSHNFVRLVNQLGADLYVEKWYGSYKQYERVEEST